MISVMDIFRNAQQLVDDYCGQLTLQSQGVVLKDADKLNTVRNYLDQFLQLASTHRGPAMIMPMDYSSWGDNVNIQLI